MVLEELYILYQKMLEDFKTESQKFLVFLWSGAN